MQAFRYDKLFTRKSVFDWMKWRCDDSKVFRLHIYIYTYTHYTYLVTDWLTYLLTYSVEQNPSWEANRFAASQEIPRILGNPNVD